MISTNKTVEMQISARLTQATFIPSQGVGIEDRWQVQLEAGPIGRNLEKETFSFTIPMPSTATIHEVFEVAVNQITLKI